MSARRAIDRAVRWFADVNGNATFIALCVLFFVGYLTVSHIGHVDPSLFYLTCFVSLVAITQNQCVLYVGKGLEEQNNQLLRHMDEVLARLDSEESQALTEIRGVDDRLRWIVAHLEAKELAE